MNMEKPKKWHEIVNDIDNEIQALEQVLILKKAQLEEAKRQL